MKITVKEGIRSWTALILTLSVLSLSTGFAVIKKQEFSENENRYLEKLPLLTWQKVADGSYTRDLGTYLADHFPCRDLFMGIKSGTEIALGRKEINGVYIADDGFLIERYQEPKNTKKIAGIFRDFAGQLNGSVNISLMLVPTAFYVYQDKLPNFAPSADQMAAARQIYEDSGIPAIDCSEALTARKNEVQLYYKTDHHWTTAGANAAYRAYCEAKGLDPVRPEQLSHQVVTESFHGTLYSKVNDYSREGDAITITYNQSNDLDVFYPDTGERTNTLYNLEYVNKKDKYSLFLNNIHPLIEITNKTAGSDRELVLIKDSYANSLVPFLVNHYKKIYVFDTRYYKQGPSNFIREHPGVTDVLLLYNLNTLDTDLGVRGIY